MGHIILQVSLILRGANDYMLNEMERALHDSLSIVKRTLESNTVNLSFPEYFFLGVLGISKILFLMCASNI